VETAVPALIEALKSEDAITRAAVARSLGALGPKATDATTALTHALTDEDETVRAAARKALDKINDR
jgi:HEAT repeat protein